MTEEKIIRLHAGITEAISMVPNLEAQHPAKDFRRLRALLTKWDTAVLAGDFELSVSAAQDVEQESFLLGIEGFSQKHLDC